MAQNQSLQHKRSTVANAKPNTSQVAIGELALNLTDKSIYTQTPSGAIIELARDIIDSAFAPTSPSEGDLWYDTTNKMVKTWNGTNWVSVTFTGLGVLAINTSAVPTFTSGSGTLASPYVYTVTTSAGTTVLSNSVTITGLSPNQFVPIVDLNSNSNGGRFQVTNYYADAGGVLKFNIMFTDLPASSAGTNYSANFKIGTGTVYVNINGAIASSFPQTVSFPTDVSVASTLWTSPGDTLTTTGDLLISNDGVTFGTGPLAITNGGTLSIKWRGGPGTGIGIDGTDGTTITGSVVDSSTGSTSSSLVIDKTPDAITFTPVTGAGLSTATDSNSQTVSGINSYAYITSSDTVLAAVASGSFGAVPTSGTSLYAVSGQTLVLRQTSSATSATTTTVTVAVGGGTTSFAVTTASVGTINTPSFTSPANGSTGISSIATLTSSAYAVTGVVGSHLNTDWQIYSNASLTTLVTSSMASTTNLTTWTPTGLGYSTQYWAQVRYRSNDGIVSSWSTTNTWTTGVQPGTTWTVRSITGTWWGVAWGNSLFVVVGESGTLITSPDGITWTTRTSGTTESFNDVIWGNSLFVAVGTSGMIRTSPNGSTWTARAPLTGQNLRDVAWGNPSNSSLFVAVGESGTIRTSSDGISWANRTSGTTDTLNGVAWGNPGGNSLFVVLGTSGARTSPDGITWTSRANASGLNGVAWGNSLFVAVGTGGAIRTSSDGITWTTRTSGTTDILESVAWSGSLFTAVGASGRTITSPDGITWTTRTSGTTNTLQDVTWGSTNFVAVGSTNTVLTSP